MADNIHDLEYESKNSRLFFKFLYIHDKIVWHSVHSEVFLKEFEIETRNDASRILLDWHRLKTWLLEE